jgi:UDP-N-acetyl-2-amino-2-deoxyglucuronate dehydrogenase
MTITFGLIGSSSNETASHAESFEACEGAILHGIYDTNCINTVKVAAGTRAFVYTDLSALLQQAEIDAVWIASSLAERPYHAVQAAKAGKHIIMEQPIAATLTEADMVIEACSRHGVVLSVAAPNRFQPSIVRMKEALENGIFGKLNHMNFTIRRSGRLDASAVLQEASHHLDLMLWMAGDVLEVSPYKDSRRSQLLSENTLTARCRFRSGAIGIFQAASTVIPGADEDVAALFGDRGTALLGGEGAASILRWNVRVDSSRPELHLIPDAGRTGTSNGSLGVLQDMVEALRTGRDPAVTGAQGRRTLALLLSIQEVTCSTLASTAASVRDARIG